MQEAKPNSTHKIRVNSMQFNTNKTLFCVSTNIGYRLYEPKHFNQVSINQPSDKYNIGDIINCTVLYNTSLIAYMMNSPLKRKFILFYDDYSKHKIGCVAFKQNISNFFLSQNFLVVFLTENKILLFQMPSLKYFRSFSSIEKNSFKYDESKKEFLTIGYIKQSHPNEVKLIKYYKNNNINIIIGQKEYTITTNFFSINKFEFIDSYIVIGNKNGNKIHIYNMDNYQFRYCIFLGNFKYEVGNFAFDKKKKFFMLSTNWEYIKVFKLEQLKLGECLCDEKGDEEELDEETKSISCYWRKLIGKTSSIYCKYRFLTKGSHLAFFDKEDKNAISVVERDGCLREFYFDRKRAAMNLKSESIWSTMYI